MDKDKFLYSQYKTMLDIAMQTELLLKHADTENWPEEKLDSLLQKRQELILAIDKYKAAKNSPQVAKDDAILKLVLTIQTKDVENQQKLEEIKAETATRVGGLRRNKKAVKAYNPTLYDDTSYFMDKKS